MIKHKILVVDDDKAIVRLMRGYLEQAGYEVLVAYDGKTALQHIRYDHPDLVLLDLMLPDCDGWDITRQIRNDPKLAQLPLIMLTARVTDADKIVGLELGADDYVTKPYNPREVVARVRARLRIQAGAQQAQPAGGAHKLLQTGQLQMDTAQRRVFLEGQEVELTVTEFDLLRVLMEYPGYVWTRSELIRTALGGDFEGIDRTVDSHIRNLRRKIEPDFRQPTYVQTVYGIGYRLGNPEG